MINPDLVPYYIKIIRMLVEPKRNIIVLLSGLLFNFVFFFYLEMSQVFKGSKDFASFSLLLLLRATLT